MAECHDKRYEDMLFAYEIGILSDEERRELELHILECEHCLSEVKQFGEAADFIRNDDETRKTVGNIASGEPEEKMSVIRPVRIWKRLVPAAAALFILVLLILQPWQIEIRPGHEAVASENRLAILDFENVADPVDSLNLGEIVANLLITDLSESHYIQVVSSQQLYDILRQMEYPDTSPVNMEKSMEIARKAGARWILLGSILQTAPELVLTSRLIDVGSGNIIKSQKIIGDSTSTIFAMIDKLTAAVKNDLPIPVEFRQEEDPMIAEVTTHSEDAYRYYLDGVDYYRKRYYAKALRSFEQVLEHDSTFAMAYYYLAFLKGGAYLDLAEKYSEHASEKDRLYIQAMQASRKGDREKTAAILEQLLKRYPDEKNALRLLGNIKYNRRLYNEAIEFYEKSLALDPYYRDALNILAYAYNSIGEFQNALKVNNKYITIAPDEPNPYDTRGELFAFNGQLDSAIAAYKKSLEIAPNFSSSQEGLGIMYVFKGEYEKAAEYFHMMASADSKATRSSGRYFLSLIPLYQGKIDQSMKVIDDCMAADRLEGADTEQGYKHVIKAVIYESMNRLDSALAEMEKSLEYYRGNYHLYIYLLARNGKMDRAMEEIKHLKDSLDEFDQNSFNYQFASGAINFVNGDYDGAIINFERSAELTDIFPAGYMLARAYLESDRYNEAIAEFEKQLSRYNSYRICRGTWSVLMDYYLGRAYEGAGRYAEAAAQYEKFLNIWKDADRPIREIDDARERLKRINRKS